MTDQHTIKIAAFDGVDVAVRQPIIELPCRIVSRIVRRDNGDLLHPIADGNGIEIAFVPAPDPSDSREARDRAEAIAKEIVCRINQGVVP